MRNDNGCVAARIPAGTDRSRSVGKTIFLFMTCCVLVLCQQEIVRAQDATKMEVKDLESMSIDQLLNIDLLQVASKKPMGRKDIPGTVTLIKREEIQNSGARDLIDVLNMVPGFVFGLDVQGVTGMGTRGNWAEEGKVLVMLDGMPMNELLYATMPFGSHFPLDQIERIEIIRGPGASFYGGYAELAVINIITSSPKDLEGVRISGQLGELGSTFGRETFSISAGKQYGELGVTASAFVGKSNRSDDLYTGVDGLSYTMGGMNTFAPLNLNVGLSYGELHTRFIYDRYDTQERDGLGVTLPYPVATNFTTFIGDVQYDYKMTDDLTLTPRLNFIRQRPYQATNSLLTDTSLPFASLFSDKIVTRSTAGLTLSGDLTKSLFITVGAEGYADRGTVADESVPANFFENGSSVSHTNLGFFVQSFWTTPVANLNAGMRYDRNSEVPAAFVPWVGVTRTIDKFNFKLLFGQNFKAPTIENISINPSIKPEKTTALEFEIGYQLKYDMFLSANIFNVSIDDPIVYGVVDNREAYFNYPRTGTRGVELEYVAKNAWGSLDATYSFYTAVDNQVPQYNVPGVSSALLAFSQHKWTLNSSIVLLDGAVTVNPSLLAYGKRYGFASVDASGVPIVRTFPPLMLVNAFVLYRNAFLHGLDLGVGAYDIFNQQFEFIQPYDGGHAPLPGPGRELTIRASYSLERF